MVWTFTKDGQQLRCEVTRADERAAYCLIVTRSDRTRTVEEIEDPVALAERAAAVMLEIHADGWQLA